MGLAVASELPPQLTASQIDQLIRDYALVVRAILLREREAEAEEPE